MNKAFSLIELAIVLIIIALVVGGVIAGRSLIKSAQLNSVATEMQKISVSYDKYKEKYEQAPGDHSKAFDYFGNDCREISNDAVDCNGNGNLRIREAINGGTYGENHILLRHLWLAGFYRTETLKGSFPSTAGDIVLGDHLPKLSISGASLFTYAWQVESFFIDACCSNYTSKFANILSLGKLTGGSGSPWPSGNVLSPRDAKKIDNKIDDGEPGTGALIAGHQDDGCADDTDMKIAEYDVSTTDIVCKIGLILEQPV